MVAAASSIDVIPTHVTRVVRSRQLGPSYVRITVGGGLDRFASAGLDDFVYVLLPPAGRDELTIDESFTWTAHGEMDEADRPQGAYYTVRQVRPDAGELDFDVFLHEPPGAVSAWAAHARSGSPLALWGPRTAFTPPPSVDWWLLVADETGLPGLARILESLPPAAPVRAFVEIPTLEDRQDIRCAPAARIEWLPRDGRPAGRTTQLLDAVQGAELPDGDPYVWGAAESRAITAVRRHVRHTLGVPRERASLTPYWRHELHAGDPISSED